MKAREIGLTIGNGQPGRLDSITDVPGVKVGCTTLIEGDGPLVVGRGPVRTGVTVILPHEGNPWKEPVFAGAHRLNGNGELTGLEWIRESGMLMSPIAITNTHSVGVVRDALVADAVRQHGPDELFWALPVVGETWDGMLNDVNGQHVKPEHVRQAIESATDGPAPEGNVGGGTGMICHGFKGGTGSASRVLDESQGGYTVGVLVQANHGRRERLRINGIPIGEMIGADRVPLPEPPAAHGAGSIIVVVATDAPLLPVQLDRVAQRVSLGIARTGGVGENTSGDIFIAFSTANRIPASELSDQPPLTVPVTMLSNAYITAVFDAVVEATEEAIVNALLDAETMVGRDGVTAHALPHDELKRVLEQSQRSGQRA